MTRIAFAFCLCALPLGADSLTAQTVDCYCTDGIGARVELGQLTCLDVGGRIFLARCAMSQNVPIWRDTGETCVTG
jgi:hypothetical protein